MPIESENNKITMATIGAKLKKARESKSLTIDQARKQTHIHSSVLTALEEGRCDEMLTATYVKSFLKKYTAYLGLDTHEILTDYLAAHPKTYKKETDIDSGEIRKVLDLSKVFSAAKYVVILAIIMFLIIFLGNKIAGCIKRPRMAAAPATKHLMRAKPKKVRAKAASKTDSGYISPAHISKSKPLKVILAIKASVMVEAKKDGVKIFKRVLQKGTKEVITARNTVELYVANGEAVEIFLNGKSLGSPGKGVIRKLEISRRGIRVK